MQVPSALWSASAAQLGGLGMQQFFAFSRHTNLHMQSHLSVQAPSRVVLSSLTLALKGQDQGHQKLLVIITAYYKPANSVFVFLSSPIPAVVIGLC